MTPYDSIVCPEHPGHQGIGTERSPGGVKSPRRPHGIQAGELTIMSGEKD